MTTSNEIDWAKAAAAWASQRQKMQQYAVPSHPYQASANPTAFSNLPVSPTTVAAPPSGASNMFVPPPGVAAAPYMPPQYHRPAGSVITAPPAVTTPFVPQAYQNFATDAQRTWFMNLASTPRPQGPASSVSPLPPQAPATSSSSTGPPPPGAWGHPGAKPAAPSKPSPPPLIPPPDVKLALQLNGLDQRYNFEDLDEFIRDIGMTDSETQGLVKKRVTSIVSSVTDSLLSAIAHEQLNEAHLQTAQQQKQRQNLKYPASSTLPVRVVPPNLVPPALVQGLNAQNQQPIDPFAPTPVQPVLLGEAGSALEEDHDDLREDRDNNGLPYVILPEPTKGLFRSPPDGVTLPLDPDPDTECVRVVCYTRNGEILGDLDLAGRPAIIFGSNPRQANVIDSHPAVYSQHCAIGVSVKAVPPAKGLPANLMSCTLYLYPLGGTTKLYTADQIPFLKKPVLAPGALPEGETPSSVPSEVSLETGERSLFTQPPFDIVADGDRKRKIPNEDQIFLQLSSSQRFYMIDTTKWKKTHVVIEADQKTKRFYTSQSLERMSSVTNPAKDPDEKSEDGRGASTAKDEETRSVSSHAKSQSKDRSRRHRRDPSPTGSYDSKSRETSSRYHRHRESSSRHRDIESRHRDSSSRHRDIESRHHDMESRHRDSSSRHHDRSSRHHKRSSSRHHDRDSRHRAKRDRSLSSSSRKRPQRESDREKSHRHHSRHHRHYSNDGHRTP